MTSAVECAFAVMVSCGIPSEAADLTMLLAWLQRTSAMSAGFIVHCSVNTPDILHGQIVHMIHKMLKVGLVESCAAVFYKEVRFYYFRKAFQ